MTEELEVQDSLNVDEATSDNVENVEETVEKELTVEDYKKLERDYKNQLARAIKAEAKLKEVKSQEQNLQTNKPKEPEQQKSVDMEEAIDIRFLKRDGFSDEDINKLRIIRDGAITSGITMTLVEAQNDEMFKAYKAKIDAEIKRKNAQLGASGGGGSNKSSKPMTEDEHKSFAEKRAQEILSRM